MSLEGEDGIIGLRDISPVGADAGEDLVESPVEENVVIGHVEVAVIVDPVRFTDITEDRIGASTGGSSVATEGWIRLWLIFAILLRCHFTSQQLRRRWHDGSTRDRTACAERCGHRSRLAHPCAALRRAFRPSEAIRHQHGATTTWLADASRPTRSSFAQSTEEVAEVVRVCGGHGCRSFPSAPAPRSRATSSRRSAASRIDLSRMNRILAVNAEDLDVRGRAGRDPQAAQRHICATRACSSRSIPAPTPPRRHGRHARLGHQRGALRHDARERARR